MHSSNDGYLDDFQLLALMNKYSINTSVFVDVLSLIFILYCSKSTYSLKNVFNVRYITVD